MRNTVRIEIDEAALGSQIRNILPRVEINGAVIHGVQSIEEVGPGLMTITFLAHDVETRCVKGAPQATKESEP